jgi:Spy/CpxP family protein refolding chaperone
MKRSGIILVLVLVAGTAVLLGSCMATKRLYATRPPPDDLDWLRQEFRLTDPEMNRVRALHDGYMPKCAEMCQQIAAKRRELESVLKGATNVNSAVEQKLSELGNLRAQCQGQMLQHFLEVSRAMAPEQGRRYLAQMQRLTLGFHEQIEHSMAHDAHGKH